MSPRFALVVVLAAFAGCLSPLDAPEPATPDLGSRAPLAFEPVVNLPMSGNAPGAYEPSVTVTREGHVVATAANSPYPSWLWVSEDAKAFRLVEPVAGVQVNAFPNGWEGHVDAHWSGASYFVDLTLASITVSRSVDGGRNWEFRTPAAAAVGGGDREWVAAGPGEAVYVTWNQIPTGFWVYGSADGGRTFPVATLIPGTTTASDEPGWSFAAVPTVAPDGTLYLARAEGTQVVVYASTDGARTFSKSVAWTGQGDVGWLFTTPAVDSNGTLYVSTVERMGETTRVRYAFSKDRGETFSAPREITAAPGVHAMQWSGAGGPGRLAIAFYELPNATGIPDEGSGDWRVKVAASDRADIPNATFQEGYASPDVVHRGTICTGGLTVCDQSTNSRNLGDYLGVDVGPDGRVHAVFIDETKAPPLPQYAVSVASRTLA